MRSTIIRSLAAAQTAARFAPATKTSPALASAVAEHVHIELHAWSAYLSAHIWFDKEGFDGFAAWARKESEEERSHAMHIMDFLLKRSPEALHFRGLPAVHQEQFVSVPGVLRFLYEKEQATTVSINGESSTRDRATCIARVFAGLWFCACVHEAGTCRAGSESVNLPLCPACSRFPFCPTSFL